MTDTEIKECQEWLDKLKLDDMPKGYKWQRSLMDITTRVRDKKKCKK